MKVIFLALIKKEKPGTSGKDQLGVKLMNQSDCSGNYIQT